MLEEIGAIDSLALISELTPSLAGQRSAAVQAAEALSAGNAALMQPLVVQRNADAAGLAGQNNAITVAEGDVPDWNDREVNRIFLGTVALGIAAFTESDKAILTAIAVQCPLTGGSTVFKARSLLALVKDATFDDEDLCTQVGERQNGGYEKGALPQLQVFPNPANDEITIVLPEHGAEGLNLMLYNAVGQSTLEKSIPAHSKVVTVNVSNLGEGLCVIKLFDRSRVIANQKFVIIR